LLPISRLHLLGAIRQRWNRVSEALERGEALMTSVVSALPLHCPDLVQKLIVLSLLASSNFATFGLSAPLTQTAFVPFSA
jgi:hypothetical protein